MDAIIIFAGIIQLFQLILQIYDPKRCQMLIGTSYKSRLHPHTVMSSIKTSRVFSRGRCAATTGAGLIPRDKHFNYNLAAYLRVVISSYSLNLAAVVRRALLFHHFCTAELHSGNCADFLRKSHLPKIFPKISNIKCK